MCLHLHLFLGQPETQDIRDIHFFSCLSCDTLSHLAQEKGFWALPSPHPLLYPLMKLARLLEGGDEGGDGY